MDLNQAIRNQTHVSTTLAAHLLSKKYPESNVVFSPFSLNVALSMVAAGAKGQTRDQFLTFLKANTTGDLNSLYAQIVSFILADGSPFGGPNLSVANGVWVEHTFPLKPSFKKVLDVDYKATCKQVDFLNKAVEVPNEVNLWAEKKTNGLIKKVLPASAVNSSTRLILANALYFKGTWSNKFNRSRTKEFDFHLLDGSKVKVPFMTDTNYQLVHVYEDFKVLGLPYLKRHDTRQFTMYFFLPHAKDGLKSLVDKMGSTSNFIDRHIPRREVKVGHFLVPKFNILFDFQASNMLKELGLELPFRGVDDFTEMVDLPGGDKFWVSEIFHKSFVEVNEEGTEAAAVSVVAMYGCAQPNPNVQVVDFVADHPFLFVIREDVTGVVLFMGQVIHPRS